MLGPYHWYKEEIILKSYEGLDHSYVFSIGQTVAMCTAREGPRKKWLHLIMSTADRGVVVINV